jgi:molybdenum cofactor guanylyltransferase
VTGVLLVGGRSRRFGSPKALARLGGETLSERGWSSLAWCDERFALGKAADGLRLPFPVADDGSAVRAPLAGVVAGLRMASHDLVVMLPVDCPGVTPDSLQKLVAACEDDAAVPTTGPLPGAYHRRTLPLLEEHLAAGKLALRDALATLAVRVVPLDSAVLVNVNTREDLERLEALARRSASSALNRRPGRRACAVAPTSARIAEPHARRRRGGRATPRRRR